MLLFYSNGKERQPLYKLIILTVFILTSSTQVNASNATSSKLENLEKPNYFSQFLIVESLIGINAWMASESPDVYGGVSALLFPLAGGENVGEFTYWSSLTTAESIAIYNIALDEDHYSKREIFKNNLLAWHLFAGVLLVNGYVDSKWFTEETVAFIPESGGGRIAFNFSF